MLHELGHCLGLEHEHQRAHDAGFEWDITALTKYVKNLNATWTDKDITEQIVQKLDDTVYNGTVYDPKSIMHYDFPPDVFIPRNGQRAVCLPPCLFAFFLLFCFLL